MADMEKLGESMLSREQDFEVNKTVSLASAAIVTLRGLLGGPVDPEMQEVPPNEVLEKAATALDAAAAKARQIAAAINQVSRKSRGYT